MDFGGGDGWVMSQDYAMHVLPQPASNDRRAFAYPAKPIGKNRK
jgi:hypothetical protein